MTDSSVAEKIAHPTTDVSDDEEDEYDANGPQVNPANAGNEWIQQTIDDLRDNIGNPRYVFADVIRRKCGKCVDVTVTCFKCGNGQYDFDIHKDCEKHRGYYSSGEIGTGDCTCESDSESESASDRE